MASLRRRLRVYAATWLVVQVASLTALVPAGCCAADRPTSKTCHEAPSATQCPMRGADGTPCPMHRGRADGGTPSPDPECRLEGTCRGPMAALVTLLSNHGILPDSRSVEDAAAVRTVSADRTEHLVGEYTPPDPPPPRA